MIIETRRQPIGVIHVLERQAALRTALKGVWKGSFGETEAGRSLFVDVLRGVAISAIFFLHLTYPIVGFRASSGNDVKLLSVLAYFINLHSHWSPMFWFFLAGLFVVHGDRARSALAFYSKRFGRLLWPYCFWIFVYMVVFNYPMTFHVYGVRLLLGIIHLWFVPSLVALYLLAPLLRRLLFRYNHLTMIDLSVICVFMIYWASEMDVEFMYKREIILFFKPLFFFMSGMYAYHNGDMLRRLFHKKAMIGLLAVAVVLHEFIVLLLIEKHVPLLGAGFDQILPRDLIPNFYDSLVTYSAFQMFSGATVVALFYFLYLRRDALDRACVCLHLGAAVRVFALIGVHSYFFYLSHLLVASEFNRIFRFPNMTVWQYVSLFVAEYGMWVVLTFVMLFGLNVMKRKAAKAWKALR